MLQKMRHSLLAKCLMVATCLPMAGCALGPLASTTGAEDGQIHSRNCSGLAIERGQHQARIAALQTAMTTELEAPPTTLVHAMQRMGDTPETGTAAHAELMAERSLLAATEAAANGLHCSATAMAKLP